MTLRLDWAAASDTGQVRANNQDSAVAEPGLFAVADGMGGHAAGEVASQVAIEAMRASDPGDGLAEAVRAANRAVIERAAADPSLRGMGTTVCALTLADDRVIVVNVGDSRAYLLRDGDLSQITEDHNLVSELERDGRISAAEAKVHPQRNIITRVLGNDHDVVVDEFPVDPFRGDRFLLCSDGLFNEVDDDAIAALLRAERDPQRAADELVRLANEGGGRDNVTVVVVDVLDDGDKARAASASLAGAAATSVSRPIPAEPDETMVHETIAAGGGDHDEGDIDIAPQRPRRMTWRAALFLLAVLLVLALIVTSIWWFGRNTYFVGVDGEEVAIFRGKPGGVLWIDPTLEERTGLDLDDVPQARRADVEAGREQPTLERAQRYVENLRDQAASERSTTTTTTSTTTSSTTSSTTTSTTIP